MGFSRHDRFGRVRVPHGASHVRLAASRSTPIIFPIVYTGHKLEAHRRSQSKTPARGWGCPRPPGTPERMELPPIQLLAKFDIGHPAAGEVRSQIDREKADAAAARIQATYRGRAVRGTEECARRDAVVAVIQEPFAKTPAPMPKHRLRLLGAPAELQTPLDTQSSIGAGALKPTTGTGSSVGRRVNLSVAPAPAPGKKSLFAKHSSAVRSEISDDMARATALEQYESAQLQKRSAWGMYRQAKVASLASKPSGGHRLTGSTLQQGHCDAWGVYARGAHVIEESESVPADILFQEAETALGETQRGGVQHSTRLPPSCLPSRS